MKKIKRDLIRLGQDFEGYQHRRHRKNKKNEIDNGIEKQLVLEKIIDDEHYKEIKKHFK
jgi:hypothetical protein